MVGYYQGKHLTILKTVFSDTEEESQMFYTLGMLYSKFQISHLSKEIETAV